MRRKRNLPRVANRGGDGVMAHPVELIEKIKGLLVEDYPLASYHYQIECTLPGNSRMRPDILILDRAKRCVCAVEVGYTRPETLGGLRPQNRS
jgi:hypothetical protein